MPLFIPLAAIGAGFLGLRAASGLPTDSVGESSDDDDGAGSSDPVSDPAGDDSVNADWSTWIWPVANTNSRDPVVSHEFEQGSRYNADGSLNYHAHLGLDLMFPRVDGDPSGPTDTVAIPKSGVGGFIAWRGTQIIAAGPGKIWDAKQTALGWSVQIDHGHIDGVGGVNTFYQHMESLAQTWSKGDAVGPGDVLGIMGGDPSNAPHLRHLHFEVWLTDKTPQSEWPVDPQPFLAHWSKT